MITPVVGPEVISGSTRLKAGTATKLILNIFTTLAMVRLGKVRGNLMVDLQPANVKLRDRAVQQYIAFAKASNFQAESPVEWFSQVRFLLSQTRSMGEAEYGKVLDALERSGNSVLYIYARLQKVMPTAPSWAQNSQ